jgi:hypothetical protein
MPSRESRGTLDWIIFSGSALLGGVSLGGILVLYGFTAFVLALAAVVGIGGSWVMADDA